LTELDLVALDRQIIACARCPRLVAWRFQVAQEKKKQFQHCEYWGKAVPNFGDPDATKLIVGLAPAAHGANRTGRMFTGDRSGDWLYRALHKAGLAELPTSESKTDSQRLYGVLITALVHCAPPDNKPLPAEFAACRPYFSTILHACAWRAILCLGKLAWDATLRELDAPRAAFSHSASIRTDADTRIFASYHPSQQNTFTGKLTEPMLDAVIEVFRDA